MKLFIIGATGGVGKHVVQKALQEGHEVTAYVRDLSKLSIQHENLKSVSGDGLDETRLIDAMAGHDAVICTVGGSELKASTLQSTITKHLIKGMKQHQMNKIVYCASAGVHKELTGISGKIVMRVLRNVLEDHHHAYEALQKSGLDWVVVRPMGLKNDETTEYRIFSHMEPPKKSSISRIAVADFMLKAAQTEQYNGQSIGLSY